jgi:hypothetical protein
MNAAFAFRAGFFFAVLAIESPSESVRSGFEA